MHAADAPANVPGRQEGEAGTAIQGFSRHFVPVGDDTTGDLLVVDLRPGEHHGCVLTWGQIDGHRGAPTWPSVAHMWVDVALALETGSSAEEMSDEDPHLTSNGCAAAFTEEGTLQWEF